MKPSARDGPRTPSTTTALPTARTRSSPGIGAPPMAGVRSGTTRSPVSPAKIFDASGGQVDTDGDPTPFRRTCRGLWTATTAGSPPIVTATDYVPVSKPGESGDLHVHGVLMLLSPRRLMTPRHLVVRASIGAWLARHPLLPPSPKAPRRRSATRPNASMTILPSARPPWPRPSASRDGRDAGVVRRPGGQPCAAPRAGGGLRGSARVHSTPRRETRLGRSAPGKF